MGNRLSKIYTRTGDDGTTGMANGDRLSKSDLTFVVMGDVDELNTHIGMISALLTDHKPVANDEATSTTATDTQTLSVSAEQLQQQLSIVQHLLFNIGGELAMPEYQGITQSHITWLETQIDTLNAHMPPLKDFILPAGSVLVSQVHIARTVCRRSERLAVRLKEEQSNAISPLALKLLNRLSDWLFVLARYCALLDNLPEVLWDKTILASLSE